MFMFNKRALKRQDSNLYDLSLILS